MLFREGLFSPTPFARLFKRPVEIVLSQIQSLRGIVDQQTKTTTKQSSNQIFRSQKPFSDWLFDHREDL